jgi:hypothetical protein
MRANHHQGSRFAAFFERFRNDNRDALSRGSFQELKAVPLYKPPADNRSGRFKSTNLECPMVYSGIHISGMSEPSRAKEMVNARGLNILPSKPSRGEKRPEYHDDDANPEHDRAA